jgi:hypothetical protein
MGGCSVPGCKSRGSLKDGIKFFSLPRNPITRELWAFAVNNNCGGGDWHYTDNSSPARLCYKHFTPDSLYTDSKNGRIKLKPEAFPTLFAHNEGVAIESDPLLVDENPLKVIEKEHDYTKVPEESVQVVDPNKILGITVKTESNEDVLIKLEYDVDPLPKSSAEEPDQNEENEDHLDIVETPAIGLDIEVETEDWQTFRIAQLECLVKVLKEFNADLADNFKKEQEEKNKVLKKAADLRAKTLRFFTDEQIKYLDRGYMRGSQWLPESILMANKLLEKCTTKGYLHLLEELKYPLPSIRTLQKWNEKEREKGMDMEVGEGKGEAKDKDKVRDKGKQNKKLKQKYSIMKDEETPLALVTTKRKRKAQQPKNDLEAATDNDMDMDKDKDKDKDKDTEKREDKDNGKQKQNERYLLTKDYLDEERPLAMVTKKRRRKARQPQTDYKISLRPKRNIKKANRDDFDLTNNHQSDPENEEEDNLDILFSS